MIHHRQKMRDKLVAILKAADIKGINDRVFGTLFFATRDLPVITTWVEGEAVEASAGEYERRVSITVTVIAKAVADVENDMDSYCAQIEATLDKTLGGLALDGWLTEIRFERKGATDQADQEYIQADLAYVFKYMTSYYDPTNYTH